MSKPIYLTRFQLKKKVAEEKEKHDRYVELMKKMKQLIFDIREKERKLNCFASYRLSELATKFHRAGFKKPEDFDNSCDKTQTDRHVIRICGKLMKRYPVRNARIRGLSLDDLY